MWCVSAYFIGIRKKVGFYSWNVECIVIRMRLDQQDHIWGWSASHCNKISAGSKKITSIQNAPNPMKGHQLHLFFELKHTATSSCGR